MKKRYIYVIEAYGYSDFETHILSHETKMSDKTFFDIVKKAQRLCKTENYSPYDYSSNVIACLCSEFGFETFDFPCVHIGCSTKSKCSMWTDKGVFEK